MTFLLRLPGLELLVQVCDSDYCVDARVPVHVDIRVLGRTVFEVRWHITRWFIRALARERTIQL